MTGLFVVLSQNFRTTLLKSERKVLRWYPKTEERLHFEKSVQKHGQPFFEALLVQKNVPIGMRQKVSFSERWILHFLNVTCYVRKTYSDGRDVVLPGIAEL
jgi:hypothetical protein